MVEWAADAAPKALPVGKGEVEDKGPRRPGVPPAVQNREINHLDHLSAEHQLEEALALA
jgi:hypothetical protein